MKSWNDYNIKYMKRHHLIFIAILLIALFFRTFKIVERFDFAHDGDLYSWIVKDIVVNHHFRLIGQLTSAPGIFIGPLFYYALIPFFLLTNMDPIGALIPITSLSLFTVFSYYLVLSKLFKKEVGLIAAFLYSVLLTTVGSDRWVVPTVATSIWAIWYFYTLIMLSRGNFFVLPILGVLIGLIWHIHIALIPTLLAIPLAILISRKLPNLKQVLGFLIGFFIFSLPLIGFEIRHNFSQTLSLISNFTTQNPGLTGFDKMQLVIGMIVRNTNSLFFSPQSFSFTNNFLFVLIILLSALLPVKIKLLSLKELLPLYAWIIGPIIFFSISKSPISEYYFANIGVIFIVIASLLLYLIYKSSKIGKFIVLGLFAIICLKNAYFLITQDYYNKGYLERKELVDFIKKDSSEKGYPCVGISYITTLGENVGFRYFFYLNKMHLVHPSIDVPTYNIVIPLELSKETEKKFGHIGLILPTSVPSKEKMEKSCQTPDTNLTDSVFGYVE